jgi:hypothetical protein
MPNNKKHKAPAECQAQFLRTMRNIGRWRGKKNYTKYKSYKKLRQVAILEYPKPENDNKYIFNPFFRDYWPLGIKPSVGFFIYQSKK